MTSLTATLRKGQSRCDSPAPRAAAETTQSPAKLDKEAPTPPLSIAAFLAVALVLGRAALLVDTKDAVGDKATWTALFAFLSMGVVVMRFDVLDMTRQEVKRQGGNHDPDLQSSESGWQWLFFASLVALVGVALACWPEAATSRQMASMQTHARPQPANISAALFEDLYMRSTKLKGDSVSIENVHGRYFDASLVRGIDIDARLNKAARRCSHEEAVAVLAAKQVKTNTSSSNHRWWPSVQLADETAIFFLTLALALGIISGHSDFSEMFLQEQEASDMKYPSKCQKGHSNWRLLACIALLIAVTTSMVAAVIQDM